MTKITYSNDLQEEVAAFEKKYAPTVDTACRLLDLKLNDCGTSEGLRAIFGDLMCPDWEEWFGITGGKENISFMLNGDSTHTGLLEHAKKSDPTTDRGHIIVDGCAALEILNENWHGEGSEGFQLSRKTAEAKRNAERDRAQQENEARAAAAQRVLVAIAKRKAEMQAAL